MNIGRVLLSDTDTHAPESWASATAALIFEVSQDIPGQRRVEAMRLQVRIAELLVSHHRQVQEDEKKALAADENHHATSLDGNQDNLDRIASEVIEAARGTPWEDEFSTPEMRGKINSLLLSHFATSRDMERARYRVQRGLPRYLPHPGEEWQKAHAEFLSKSLEEAERRASSDGQHQ